VQASGKIVAGGETPPSRFDAALARFGPHGGVDLAFVTNGRWSTRSSATAG